MKYRDCGAVPRELWEPVVQAARCPRDAALLGLLLWCGLRPGECVALNVGDVDLVAELVLVGGSAARGVSRCVYCHRRATELLRGYLAHRIAAAPDEPLFLSRHGRRLTCRQLRNVVRAAGAELGWPCSAKALRRAHAEVLLQRGAEAEVVAQHLGYRRLRGLRNALASRGAG